jgi:copper chaperone CopZ
MFLRTAALFVATASLSVALACGGAPCGACDAAAKTAQGTDLSAVAGESVKLNVTGVHCGGTAASFHATVTKIEGVTGATVGADGKAEVKFDPAKTTADKIIAAVAEKSSFKATKSTDEA